MRERYRVIKSRVYDIIDPRYDPCSSIKHIPGLSDILFYDSYRTQHLQGFHDILMIIHKELFSIKWD